MSRARRSSEFVGSDSSSFFYTSLSLVFFFLLLDMNVDWVEFPGLVGRWEMDGLFLFT